MRKTPRVLAFLVSTLLITVAFGVEAGALFVAVFVVAREISKKG